MARVNFTQEHLYIIIFILFMTIVNLWHDNIDKSKKLKENHNKNKLKKSQNKIEENSFQKQILEGTTTTTTTTKLTTNAPTTSRPTTTSTTTKPPPEFDSTKYHHYVSSKKINLDPVKLPENYKGTIIVAFTDINYWAAAKLWFQQMKKLKYKNIRIYVLDTVVYQEMQNEIKKGNMKPENAHLPRSLQENFDMFEISEDFVLRTEFDENFKESTYYRQGNLAKVWKIRVQVTLHLLKQGYSILQLDVDSLWMRYVDFDRLPMNFDIIFSIAAV